MLVMKFGGASLTGAEAMERMAGIVAGERRAVAVVVSALGDTTDRLLEIGRLAEGGDRDGTSARVEQLRARHREAARLDPAALAHVEALFEELESMLEGVRLLREQTARSRALLMSFGERLSAPLFALMLRHQGRDAQDVDARGVIVTDERYEGAVVQGGATRQRLKQTLGPLLERGTVPVVTGFIASTAAGVTTTLGRSGSDYTATLVGAALEAEEIQIYTDVDGLLSADPRLVKEARSLPRVSYREAAEMSFFGARVLHPRTMLPAAEAGIPVRVRSSLDTSRPGTLIAGEAPTLPLGVKTVTSVQDQALVTIDGRGMAGTPGVARRIFEASELAGVNVALIAQASSEQTVSLVVPKGEAQRLVSALEERFAPEIARGAVERIQTEPDVAVVSIIGQGMAGQPGIAGRFFSALGRAHVNVRAIAQGGSELSISVVVGEREARRAVRASHTAFGLTRIVNILLVGCGRVGGTFVKLLEQTRARMKKELDLELRLVGVVTKDNVLLDTDGIAPAAVPRLLSEAPASGAGEDLIGRVLEQRYTDVVLVDATAADTTKLHLEALNARFHVVTANKLPLSGSLGNYRQLQAASRAQGVRYNYETTFGAGLPVLHTLQELLHTGDTPLRISGCLSGTLGFICSRLDEDVSLAEAVAEAEARGFTEPDPREDLSGRDVARKALIIARACGLEIEPSDVELEALVPGLELGLGEAIARFQPQLDASVARARGRGEVMRYVAEICPERVRVGLQAVSARSPVGLLRGPDNILVFETERYREHPLVIQGPGAGAEVTAAGVLGDVLRIAGTTPTSEELEG